MDLDANGTRRPELKFGVKSEELLDVAERCEAEFWMCVFWSSYFSGVDLLGIDREEELRLSVLQLDPIRVELQEAHAILQQKKKIQMRTGNWNQLRGFPNIYFLNLFFNFHFEINN